MLDNPIGQRPLKANIASCFFGLDPFVLEDLLPLRLELPVERRVLQQIICRERLFRFVSHNHDHASKARSSKHLCESMTILNFVKPPNFPSSCSDVQRLVMVNLDYHSSGVNSAPASSLLPRS